MTPKQTPKHERLKLHTVALKQKLLQPREQHNSFDQNSQLHTQREQGIVLGQESRAIVKEICRQLIADTNSAVDFGHTSNDIPSFANESRKEVQKRALELVKKSCPLDSRAFQETLLEEVLSSLWGLGQIEVLFKDPQINEIMINGPGQVWIEKAGKLKRSELVLDLPAIQDLIERIVAPLGLRVDRTNPQVDARLLDGARVHIVAPPLAIDGPYITIRRFLRHDFQISDFTATPGIIEFLKWAVWARANVVVSGGTSSGKTTLLNALARHIDSNQRLITIEDAAELALNTTHIVRLETRLANAEGVGETTQRDLVKSALRMRPDRILVGEVRGAEALDMVQAMNTGNEGSLSTCHANSAKDTLRRLETMVLMANSGLTLDAIREQIISALDFVVHLRRLSNGERRIMSVAEISEDKFFCEIANEEGLYRLPECQPRNSSAGFPLPSWLHFSVQKNLSKDRNEAQNSSITESNVASNATKSNIAQNKSLKSPTLGNEVERNEAGGSEVKGSEVEGNELEGSELEGSEVESEFENELEADRLENDILDNAALGNTVQDDTTLDNTSLDNIALDDTALGNTVQDDTALDNASLDNAYLGNTAQDNTALDDTALGNTVQDDTALDNTSLDNAYLGNTALDDTAQDDTALGNASLGNTAQDDTALDNTALDNESQEHDIPEDQPLHAESLSHELPDAEPLEDEPPDAESLEDELLDDELIEKMLAEIPPRERYGHKP